MRNPEDLPRIPNQRGGRGRRIGLGLILALLALAASLFRGAANFYTDYLWFDTIALTDIWSQLLGTKVVLGALSVAFFFLVIWINLWVADKVAPRNLVLGQEDDLVRQFQKFARPRAGLVRAGAAFVLALLSGLGFYNYWNEWLLFRNGGSFGIADPQFGRDIGFFVFRLPFLDAVAQWTFYALVFATMVALVAHYLQGSIRPQAPTNRVSPAVKAHISVLLGLLALVRAVQYYLDRFQLSYSERGVVTGASYTDVNFLLPALGLLMLISLLAALLFFVGARTRTWSLPVITVVLWAATSILIGSLIPVGVQRLSVEPAEPEKEAPYIERNIEATRQAMRLNVVEEKNFEYTKQLNAADLQENAQTIRNVRLWDPTYLRPSYKRLQESRAYFQFVDIDVDRYDVNGDTTQMMLSVRELNPDGLPADRRSWVNQHLAFTHGYGAVMSPANAVTANGEPQFLVRDLPVTGEPAIDVPQVYFGERQGTYAIANTRQGEVDYVTAEGRDQTSRYEGEGGVLLNNIARKVAFATRVGSINPVISDLVTEESRAMYITNIRERVMKAAPFLQFDNDPYPILFEGRIVWMQDAYTTSNHYPYAQHGDTSLVEPNGQGGGLRDHPFNYLRNSVKIVTDAYDGTMTFYVVDDTDPVIKAYQRAFPELFVSGNTMPEGLREHMRYPEDLFQVQSSMFGRYHLEDPQEFYSRSDLWNIAQSPETGTPPATTAVPNTQPPLPGAVPVRTGERRIEPYYLLMRLPGDEKESFLMFQPFVPFSPNDERKELSAFMVAKSDPERYGELEAYVMPRGQQVDGPALAGAKIQQDPTISQYITLLSREGSRVDLGNMLIIPVENSLLYVRPLYVTARQTGVPEFKKAIVVQGDSIAFADTLQQALAQIFGSAPATQEAQPTPGVEDSPIAPNAGGGPIDPTRPTTSTSTPIPTQQSPERVRELLDQANAEFARADQALRDGNLGAYQEAVRRGADLVRQARGA